MPKTGRPRRTWTEFVAAFWAKVDKTDTCWLWTGGVVRTQDGFVLPRCHPPGQRGMYSHRMSWSMEYGPISDGMEVCHKCDRPLCVRPDHLFLGTHADNMRDMAQKQRASRGEKNGASRLTAEQVQAIRIAHEAGASYSALGRQYGVSHVMVRKIVLREYWRHVA